MREPEDGLLVGPFRGALLVEVVASGLIGGLVVPVGERT